MIRTAKAMSSPIRAIRLHFAQAVIAFTFKAQQYRVSRRGQRTQRSKPVRTCEYVTVEVQRSFAPHPNGQNCDANLLRCGPSISNTDSSEPKSVINSY
jgi:hypothetical protein